MATALLSHHYDSSLNDAAPLSRQNRQPRRSEAEPRWIGDREIWAGWLVVVRDQGALDGRADLPVAPDDGVERQQALDIAGPQACGDAAAVAFEAELVFEGPDDRLNALAQPVREVPGSFLVGAGGPDQGQFQAGAG